MAGERTLPGLGIKGYWTAGSDGWSGDDQMDGNWRTLSAVTQLTVLSMVASLPGSPTNGQIYINSSTGVVSLRDNGAWVNLTPQTGWRAWVVDQAAEFVWTGSAWKQIAPLPAFIGTFSDVTPVASAVLLDWIFAEAVTFPDEFAGSVASVGTNPTSSFVVAVQKNGSSVGSITISTSGAATFTTTGTTVSFAIGDVLTLVAPATPDASVARLRVTLKGLR